VAHGVKHAAQGAEQLISQGEAHRTIAPSPGFSFDGSFDAPTLFITGYFHAVFIGFFWIQCVKKFSAISTASPSASVKLLASPSVLGNS